MGVMMPSGIRWRWSLLGLVVGPGVTYGLVLIVFFGTKPFHDPEEGVNFAPALGVMLGPVLGSLLVGLLAAARSTTAAPYRNCVAAVFFTALAADFSISVWVIGYEPEPLLWLGDWAGMTAFHTFVAAACLLPPLAIKRARQEGMPMAIGVSSPPRAPRPPEGPSTAPQ